MRLNDASVFIHGRRSLKQVLAEVSQVAFVTGGGIVRSARSVFESSSKFLNFSDHPGTI
jgi:hypothetical protein